MKCKHEDAIEDTIEVQVDGGILQPDTETVRALICECGYIEMLETEEPEDWRHND